MSLTPNSELADCREVLAAMDIKIDSISGHLAQCQKERDASIDAELLAHDQRSVLGAQLAQCQRELANEREQSANLIAQRDAYERAILAIIDATQRYLPLGGISKDDLITCVLAATDNAEIVGALKATAQGKGE